MMRARTYICPTEPVRLKVPEVHAALREHYTSVQSRARSGDGARVARGSLTLIAPALVGQIRRKIMRADGRLNGRYPNRRRLCVESEGEVRHAKLHLDGFISAWVHRQTDPVQSVANAVRLSVCVADTLSQAGGSRRSGSPGVRSLHRQASLLSERLSSLGASQGSGDFVVADVAAHLTPQQLGVMDIVETFDIDEALVRPDSQCDKRTENLPRRGAPGRESATLRLQVGHPTPKLWRADFLWRSRSVRHRSGVGGSGFESRESLDGDGAAVAERLPCSLLTKANRVQSPAGSLPDFRMWESCRAMPLTSGFSRGSPSLSAIYVNILKWLAAGREKEDSTRKRGNPRWLTLARNDGAGYFDVTSSKMAAVAPRPAARYQTPGPSQFYVSFGPHFTTDEIFTVGVLAAALLDKRRAGQGAGNGKGGAVESNGPLASKRRVETRGG
ncbi:hypothetical protein PR048_022920 [Dryococelus australis]|uniref:Uncharacterized protein n=1 Tax=Dryococelus australis TaxID=614101 RepID=A0ABQ9GSN0_9NEOP|nr:hypothetical protein PR048_022920 [Dryococelus australis]